MVFCCIDDDRPRLSAKKLKTVIPEEDGEAQQHGEPQTKAGGGGGQPPVAVITALESPRVSTSAAELTPFSAAASVVAQPDPSSSQQQLQESSFGAVGRRNPMVLLAPLAASLTATPTENLYPSQKLPNILHHHHHQNQIQNQEPHNINQASDKLVDPDDGSQQQDHPNSSAAASSSRPTSSKSKSKMKTSVSMASLADRTLALRASISKSLADLKHKITGSYHGGQEADERASDPPQIEHIRIFIATWNMNGKIPKGSLGALLATGVNSNCHILAIGSQECEKSIEKSLVFPSKEEWERRLLLEVQEDYILIKTETLGATHLAIFTHRSFEKYIKDSDSSRIATGIGNMLGNKGSIAISVYLEQTDILFVNSHFSAHQSNVVDRNNDFKRSNEEMRLLKCAHNSCGPLSERYTYVFWFGDFNYRVNATRTLADRLIQNARFEVLLNNDQLQNEMKKGRVFEGFSEAAITFPPTYKFDTTSETPSQPAPNAHFGLTAYDSSGKMRIPSWTDRVLFRCQSLSTDSHHLHQQTSPTKPSMELKGRESTEDKSDAIKVVVVEERNLQELPPLESTSIISQPHIRIDKYDAVPDFTCSDHKPVIAKFTLAHGFAKQPPPLEELPDDERAKKTICSIQ